MKRSARYFAAALAVVLLDQAVKLVVKTTMRPGQDLSVLGHFFRIHFLENAGAAFGLTISALLGGFMEVSERTGKLALTFFSLALVGFIGYFLYTLRSTRTALPWLMALVLGGAVGNIVDRVFYGIWFSGINEAGYPKELFQGRVVDMFYFDIWQGIVPGWVPGLGGQFYSMWPVFNVADASISVGIVAILIFQRRLFPKPVKAALPSSQSGALIAPLSSVPLDQNPPPAVP